MTISVCIPTVRPRTLGKAIRSVVGQTWSDWELLILGQGDAATEAGLRAAMGEMTAADRETISRAIPVLERLSELLSRVER